MTSLHNCNLHCSFALDTRSHSVTRCKIVTHALWQYMCHLASTIMPIGCDSSRDRKWLQHYRMRYAMSSKSSIGGRGCMLKSHQLYLRNSTMGAFVHRRLLVPAYMFAMHM